MGRWEQAGAERETAAPPPPPQNKKLPSLDFLGSKRNLGQASF